MNSEEQKQADAIARAFESSEVRDELKSVADMMTDADAAPFGAVHLLAGQVAARVIQLRVVQDMAREDRERAAKMARESIEASVDAAIDDVGSWLMWMHGFHAARFRNDRFVLGGEGGAPLSMCSEMLLETTRAMVDHLALGADCLGYSAKTELNVAWARISYLCAYDQCRCLSAMLSAAEHAPLSLRPRFAAIAAAMKPKIEETIERERRRTYVVCDDALDDFIDDDGDLVYASSAARAAEHAIDVGRTEHDVTMLRGVEVFPTIDRGVRDVGDLLADAIEQPGYPDSFDASEMIEKHFSPELAAIRAKVDLWNEKAKSLSWWIAGREALSEDEVRAAFDEARKRADGEGVVSGEEKSG